MDKINCFKCRHFRTTWNPAFPRSCSAYEFKTKELPSAYILRTTGSSCMQFQEKKTPKKENKARQASRIDLRL
ncbi:hypothetical protein [Halobacillus sp. KGW1]|uniref:hypothetical protein n=1 Tax=Halobacillus sp. KGW1 TaxID=1793726 RepID=UPI000785F0E5|nr:hypothetical protein [Halobacillus sp. KGW1]